VINEGNACVGWVGYDIINVSTWYCIDEINEIIITTRLTGIIKQ
jgi:hypothetical protein